MSATNSEGAGSGEGESRSHKQFIGSKVISIVVALHSASSYGLWLGKDLLNAEFSS